MSMEELKSTLQHDNDKAAEYSICWVVGYSAELGAKSVSGATLSHDHQHWSEQCFLCVCVTERKQKFAA